MALKLGLDTKSWNDKDFQRTALNQKWAQVGTAETLILRTFAQHDTRETQSWSTMEFQDHAKVGFGLGMKQPSAHQKMLAIQS